MKRQGLAVAFVLLCAVSAAGAMTKAQAKKVIADHGFPETPDGMMAVLNMSIETAPLVVEAYLTLGMRADREITYEADGHQMLTRYPLTYMLMFCCADDTTAAMAKLLVDAGADPNTTDPENDWAALSQAHACPDVIRVLLDAPKKPDVNRVDRNGNTAMHLVVSIGGDRQLESIRMLLDAGFDIAKWRLDAAEGRARQRARHRRPRRQTDSCTGSCSSARACRTHRLEDSPAVSGAHGRPRRRRCSSVPARRRRSTSTCGTASRIASRCASRWR